MNTKIETGGRIEWIDIAKSIGLIFIIIGHNIFFKYQGAKYIYWFHVPLFFMLSGILHRQNIPTFTFIQARFKHLMIPYLFFLSICFLIKPFGYCNQISITNLLLGGIYLSESGSNILMKWWFIPCLFATQIAAFFILKLKNYKAVICIVLISYFTAIMIEWKYSVFLWGVEYNLIKLPLSLEIVPMSLVFYLIVFFCKRVFLSADYNTKDMSLLLLFILLTTILLDYSGVITIPFFNMYGQQYGFPIVNIVIPLICFILVRYVSLLISRLFIMKNIFIAIGQAAMPIMFLHLLLPIVLIQCLDKVIGLNIDCLVSRIALGIFFTLFTLLFF
jgi:fucose 4-O-acetylase-like acetyltransferase